MKCFLMMLAALVAMVAPSHSWADSQYRMLVLAMASKYHYEYIPIARESLLRLTRLHAIDMTWTSAPASLEQDLSSYTVVMLLNTPVEDLTPAQKAGFEAYVKAGGNVVVVHRAAMALPANSWAWYEKLVGRTVGVHPMLQTGVVTVTDEGFPAAYAVPRRWVWSDEFYTTTNPYNVEIHTVLSVDETSYDPTKIWPGQVVKPMGQDHPIAWYHSFEKGRVFVTTLGHNGDAYGEPTYLAHLMGGVYWAATGLGQAH